MYRVIALLLLAACMPRQAVAPAFREASAPIYSSAALDTGRMTGRWSQVAGFAASGTASCAPAGVEIGAAGDGLTVQGALCIAGRRVPVAGTLARAGTGRFALRGADPQGLGQVWWVLWADTGYRTLIVGTPSGAFGFILNRGGPLPPDRATAAREILDFNGYDTGRLVPVPVAISVAG